MKALSGVAALMLLMVVTGPAVLAQTDDDDDDQDQAALAKVLTTAKVTLEAGLTASSAEGRPISGKFEMDEGKLQLSVYTEKSGKFYEVVVDHETGKAAKPEPITEGGDLAAAKGQSEAMSKAKLSLRAAVGKAVAANAGFRAVSVFPETKDGHPVATVNLVKGQEWKVVSESLD